MKSMPRSSERESRNIKPIARDCSSSANSVFNGTPPTTNSTVRNPNGSTVFVELHPAKNIPRRIQSKGLNQRGTVNFRFNVHSDFKSLPQRRTKHAGVTHLPPTPPPHLTVPL